MILKYYQFIVQNAVHRGGFQLFWILCSPRWENFEITLESWPLLEGDFGLNLSILEGYFDFSPKTNSPRWVF